MMKKTIFAALVVFGFCAPILSTVKNLKATHGICSCGDCGGDHGGDRDRTKTQD